MRCPHCGKQVKLSLESPSRSSETPQGSGEDGDKRDEVIDVDQPTLLKILAKQMGVESKKARRMYQEAGYQVVKSERTYNCRKPDGTMREQHYLEVHPL